MEFGRFERNSYPEFKKRAGAFSVYKKETPTKNM